MASGVSAAEQRQKMGEGDERWGGWSDALCAVSVQGDALRVRAIDLPDTAHAGHGDDRVGCVALASQSCNWSWTMRFDQREESK